MAMESYPKHAASHYWKAGLSVIPVRGKKPAVKWQQYTEKRASAAQVEFWKRSNEFHGVGIVCGKVSGGLTVIDLDGMEAVKAFYRLFPHLTKTLTVISGSGKGRHLYYWCQDTSNKRMKGFDVRGDGCYVVAPPSIHPATGRQYKLIGYDKVQRIELTEVRDWIESRRPSSSARPDKAKHGVGNTTAWAEAALSGELRTLLQTTSDFNNALYRAALKLGSMIGAGHLNEMRVEDALYNVARQAGYVERDGSKQTVNTIASGIRNGKTTPRERKQA